MPNERYKHGSNEMYSMLVSKGLPDKIAAELQVNLGDIAEACEQMTKLLRTFGASRKGDLDIVLEIESEVRDHLPGHVKALGKVARQLGRFVETTNYPGPQQQGDAAV